MTAASEGIHVNPHRIVDIPLERRAVLAFMDLSPVTHYAYAFVEVDVTLARRRIAERRDRTGEDLSFTGYLTYCLARAVAEDTSVQAYRKGRTRLALFDDVDVGLMIERTRGEVRAPLGHVIRRADQKSVLDIHREIRAVQAMPPPSKSAMPAWMRVWSALPLPLPGLVTALVRAAMRRDPARAWVPMAGTVAVTAVGMFGSGGGWALATPDGHTITLIVGGIEARTAVVGDHIQTREFLSLTLAFNHDVVDGAPAARFTDRLVSLVERAEGLVAPPLG